MNPDTMNLDTRQAIENILNEVLQDYLSSETAVISESHSSVREKESNELVLAHTCADYRRRIALVLDGKADTGYFPLPNIERGSVRGRFLVPNGDGGFTDMGVQDVTLLVADGERRQEPS